MLCEPSEAISSGCWQKAFCMPALTIWENPNCDDPVRVWPQVPCLSMAASHGMCLSMTEPSGHAKRFHDGTRLRTVALLGGHALGSCTHSNLSRCLGSTIADTIIPNFSMPPASIQKCKWHYLGHGHCAAKQWSQEHDTPRHAQQRTP